MRKLDKRILIAFTPFERELLVYLTLVHPSSASFHVRQALRLYASEYLGFDLEAFEQWLRAKASGAEAGEEPKQLLEDLDQFLADQSMPTTNDGRMPKFAINSRRSLGGKR